MSGRDLSIEFVSASAGSGKTWRVVTAAVEAIADGSLRPEALVATTFSVRAATSLRDALQRRLCEAGRSNDVLALAGARIGTVHSLCASLLQTFAYSLGRPTGLRVADAHEAAGILRDSLEQTVTVEELRCAQRLRVTFEGFDALHDAADVVSLARAMRLDAKALRETAKASADSLLQSLGPSVDGAALDGALDRALGSLGDALSPHVVRDAQQRRARGEALPWSTWLGLSSVDGGVALDERLRPLRRVASSHTRHPALHAQLREAVELVTSLSARALAPFAEARRRAGVIDYLDLESIALDLLRRDDVREALRGTFGLVVVDEFQDSSPLQLALFVELASLAPRSLWVGDLKQSIYGFRGADPELVARVVEATTAGRAPETLGRSWRSRAPLVELTSGLFAPPFVDGGMPEAQVRLVAASPDDPSLGHVVERWRVPEAVALQPAAIARGVAQLLDDPTARVRDPRSGDIRRPEARDVAVLARTHRRCGAIARALAALKIPSDYARAGLLSTPEVALTLAAMRLLDDPDDRLAQAEVARLTAEAPGDDAWLHAALEREDALAALPAVAALRAARRDALAPVDAFDVATLEQGLRAHVLRWGDGAQRGANLDALRVLTVRWGELRQAQRRPVSMPGFVAWLRGVARDGDDLCGRVEGAAVSVLTWHASKGLEWPIVVLADLDVGIDDAAVLGAQVREAEAEVDLADVMAGQSLRYWPSPYARGEEGALTSLALRADGASKQIFASATRESLRLLYVAWTRARDRLCLAAPTGLLNAGVVGLLRRQGTPLAPEPRLGKAMWLRRAWPVVERTLTGKTIEAARDEGAEVTVDAVTEGAAGPHPALWTRPSDLTEAGVALRSDRIGSRHVPYGAFDPMRLGTTLHAVFAASLHGVTLSAEEIAAFAARFGVGDALTPDAVLAMCDALNAWIARAFPGAAVLAEHPVLRAMPDGSVLRGSVDVAIITDDGVVVVDHKSHFGDDAEGRSAEHWGQLRAYGEALAAAYATRLRRCWIHLPLAGRVVQIGGPNAEGDEHDAPTSERREDTMPLSTAWHAKYLAHGLRLERPQDNVVGLARSIGNAKVDLNPHQVDAALFALQSPFSKGVLLADEVGLGKTIEAGIVIAQKWAEKRRRILLIVLAGLRSQWQAELASKFFIPSAVLETKTFNDEVKKGNPHPFTQTDKVVIISHDFAYSRAAEVAATPWDLVVVDEAHYWRSIYKKPKKATKIVEALKGRQKVLLTATPLQNSLLELYGLVSILDPDVFGSQEAFSAQYIKNEDADDRNALLRDRIRHVYKRTLRRDVLMYIQYTERKPITLEFTPSPTELELYERVSDYLQRKVLVALPARQRKLIQMIMWKLLASSSRAIAATLTKFVEKLRVLQGGSATAADVEAVTQDFEAIEDSTESWDDDEGEGGSTESAFGASDRTVSDELSDLKRYIALAASIGEDEKTRKLKEGLTRAFADCAKKGGPRKAVIFTESVKTQEYLVEWLSANGYEDKIVVMNGTNGDETSKKVYAAWKERNKARWDEVSSKSRIADTKTAIVEEFRSERREILVATESAAAGVNLQFCSIVVNYDLPWNPQRVEQRIGRCHRYGQKHDVLVVNFVNMKNEADRRVYELLEQKFELFSGVFGASDHILGFLENGVNIEQAIAEIYQTCRAPEEIRAAFERLQSQVEETVRLAKADVKQKVLDHLDADVQRTLDVHREEAQRTLNDQQIALLALCRHALASRATFDATVPRFVIADDDPDAGAYNFDWKKADASGEVFFRTEHPLAVRLCDEAIRAATPDAELRFTWHPSAAPLGAYVGRSGWLRVSVLTLKAVSRTSQWLLHAACTDEGEVLDEDVAARLFSLDAVEVGTAKGAPPAALKRAHEALRARRVDELSQRNKEYFDVEQDKLAWRADDLKQGLEREIKALDKELAALEREARRERDMRKTLELQEKIRGLEESRKRKRRTLFDEQDRLDEERGRLIADLTKTLEVSVPGEEMVFTVRWSLVR